MDKNQDQKNDKTAGIVFAILAVVILLALVLFGSVFFARQGSVEPVRVAPVSTPAAHPDAAPTTNSNSQDKNPAPIDPLDQTSGTLE